MIKTAEFVISNTDFRNCPKDNMPEYAFIGRSNVGKSSLINMLCNRPNLAKVSAKPGKTLLINHFIINNEWYLVDLPGYGYATVGKNMREKLQEMIENYIHYCKNLICLFVLIDSRHEPQQIDMEFMEWLGENEIPFAIVFTKVDKLSAAKQKENTEKYIRQMLQTWEEMPPYFLTSSEKKTGKDELTDYIEQINQTLKDND